MVEAVERAIEESIGKGVLAEFLRKNRDEVLDMNYSWARKSVKHEEDGWVKKLEKCKQLRI